MTRRMIAQFAAQKPRVGQGAARLAELTDREREVLVLIGNGHSNSEIAASLFIAEQTVKTHVGNVLGKTGMRDRVALVVLAYECGVVGSD